MAQNDVDIRVRLRGGRVVAAEARGVAGAVDSIGFASTRAARQMGHLKGVAGGITGAFSGLGGAMRTASRYTLGFAGAATAYSAVAGLKFNATMEQNTVAFTNFLGSADKARAYLDRLYKLAATTPFEFTDLTNASVKLMGFGMSAKDTTSILTSLGDAVAGVGGDAETIQRVTTAIGQIQAKGKLSMEELNQLSEARIGAAKIIRDQLGLSKAEFAKTFTPGNQIGADKALNALQKGLDLKFGGEAAKQAKTFNGQLSTLKDNLNQTFGKVTYPGFLALRDKVFPSLNKAATDVTNVWSATPSTTKGKIAETKRVILRDLGPLAHEVEDGIRKAHLGEKLASFVEAAAPKIADAAARAAPRAASAFVKAFRDMGPWGKLLTTAFLAWRFRGVFMPLGRLAAGSFAGGFSTRVGPELSKRQGAMGLGAFGRGIGGLIGIAAAAQIGILVGDELDRQLQAHTGFHPNAPGSPGDRRYGKTTGALEPFIRKHVPGAEALYSGLLDRGSGRRPRGNGSPFGTGNVHPNPIIRGPLRLRGERMETPSLPVLKAGQLGDALGQRPVVLVADGQKIADVVDKRVARARNRR